MGVFPGLVISRNIFLMPGVKKILSLVFILTHSVADSVGKQFEIISLILLRDSFKEMGHLPLETVWSAETLLELLPLLADALGAGAVPGRASVGGPLRRERAVGGGPLRSGRAEE